MRVVKLLARSPWAWITLVLGALFVAPLGVGAQEIVQLTPANPSANGQIVGNKGIASDLYQIDYVAGQFVDLRLTPTDRTQWWPLTANRRARSRNGGLWAEVWTPTGRIDTADLRKSMSSSCTPAQARRDGSCISFRASGADVIHPLSGPFMVKVSSTAPISIPYTIEARRLGAPRATNPGAPAGGEGPMLSNRNAQTGSLTGSVKGSSAFYTFMHPGGGDRATGGAQTEFSLVVTPNFSVALHDKVGINVYRGALKVAGNGTGRGGVGAKDDSGVDATQADGGTSNHLTYSLKYNSPNPELLTVEVFNYTPGTTIQYAIHET
jgi:hypothetical protein